MVCVHSALTVQVFKSLLHHWTSNCDFKGDDRLLLLLVLFHSFNIIYTIVFHITVDFKKALFAGLLLVDVMCCSLRSVGGPYSCVLIYSLPCTIHVYHRSTSADYWGSGHLAAAGNHKWSQKVPALDRSAATQADSVPLFQCIDGIRIRYRPTDC